METFSLSSSVERRPASEILADIETARAAQEALAAMDGQTFVGRAGLEEAEALVAEYEASVAGLDPGTMFTEGLGLYPGKRH